MIFGPQYSENSTTLEGDNLKYYYVKVFNLLSACL